jgi:hypothetical protein
MRMTMGDMKLPKRRKKETEAVAETSAIPQPAPKVEVRKKARPTDDVIAAPALRSDEGGMGTSMGMRNGHNGHAQHNGAAEAIDENERRRLIAEAAYFRAVRRNFANGTPEADWLEAEAEVGAWLSQQRH